MAKYEVDRFESPPDPDLVCCICQCVLDKPLQSPCQHVFCKVCIETWLTNRKNCPNCRKSLRRSKLKPVIPIVRNMINRLIIRCDNYSHGCIEGIKLEYYDVHVKQCDYVPLKCMNTGCEVTVLRKDMLAHEKECHFRLVVCRKGCGYPVAADQQQNHSCVAVLKANMECMEEAFNKKYKALSENFVKLQKQVDKLQDKLQLQQNSTASRDSGNEEHSSYSTGATTPVPNDILEEDRNSQTSPNSYGSPARENEHWRDTASDDSFITGRGTPVNREDQHSNWSWLNSEEDDQTDVGDLEDSAVDALLASDVDNTPSSPRPREASTERDRRRHASPSGSYEESREDSNTRSENVERDDRQSRTASQGERARYSLRSSSSNNAADSTSNVNGDPSGMREEGNDDVTPMGSPAAHDSHTNSDNDSFEPTGSDSSPVTSHVGSLRTTDTSPPSSPVSFNNFLNSVAQMNSSSDFTWSPSSDAMEPSRQRPASSSHDRSGWHSERESINTSSQRVSHHTEREDNHHSYRRRRRRSAVYYSSDEDLDYRRSDQSRKRSRRR